MTSTPRLPLRIVVRTKADWANMDPERFAAQRGPTLPTFHIRGSVKRRVLDVWNDAFRMSYFEYRARLQQIASDSQRQVQNATITVGLNELRLSLSTPGEEIIVPTDDDDFFQPNLAQVVDAFHPDTNVVIWPNVTMGVTRAEPERRFQRRGVRLLFSNNWAIRKTYLARRFDLETARLMLAHHTKANEAIADDLGIPADAPNVRGCRLLEHPDVRIISDAFSLYNSHVGSIYVLLEILMSEDPVRFLQSLDLATPIELPPDVRAFEPYIRRFEALTSGLVKHGSRPTNLGG